MLCPFNLSWHPLIEEILTHPHKK